jgi:3-oxoacyl-[acyl-carrier-protein] synthase II
VLASADPALLEVECVALDAVFARRPAVVLNPAELTGDTGAATGAFQLAAVLATAEPGLAVLTGLDRDGTVGCALLRVTGSTAGGPTAE